MPRSDKCRLHTKGVQTIEISTLICTLPRHGSCLTLPKKKEKKKEKEKFRSKPTITIAKLIKIL